MIIKGEAHWFTGRNKASCSTCGENFTAAVHRGSQEPKVSEPTRCEHGVWLADHCYQCGAVKSIQAVQNAAIKAAFTDGARQQREADGVLALSHKQVNSFHRKMIAQLIFDAPLVEWKP